MKINPYLQVGKGRPAEFPHGAEDGKAAPCSRNFPLTPGQLLPGRVLRVEEGGRVLLAVNQEMITARTALPLTEGSEHWFEVRRGGAEPWLTLASGKGAALELLRFLTAEEAVRSKALQLLLDSSAGRQPAWPAAVITHWRNLTGQLAGGAIGSQADPASIIFSLLLLMPPDYGWGSFRRRLAELLDLLPAKAPGRKEVESLAGMLLLCDKAPRLAEPGERFFLLPCLLTGGAGWGEWFFSLESGEKEAVRSGPYFRLSFFLRLSRLGELYLQADRRGNSIHGRIHAADGQTRQHLEGYLPELCSCLENLGFQSVRFSCHLAEHRLLRELQEELRRRAGLKSLALVDLRA